MAKNKKIITGTALAFAAALLMMVPAVAGATVTAGQSNTTALSSGLVGYWTLDGNKTNWLTGTIQDSSGNGNTGQLVGMSTTTSPVLGKIGQALKFNGTGSEVHTTTNISDPQIFTLGVWFKTTVASGHKLVGFEDISGGSYDRMIYMGTDGLIYFGWYPGSVEVITSLHTLNDGKWHSAVATFNNGFGALYIDGVLQGTLSAGGAQNFSAYWNIGGYKTGGWPNASDGYFDGTLDDVHVYNRTLSAQEVAQLYSLGQANVAHSNTTALSSGLLLYWPLDGNTLNWTTGAVADKSGNGFTGQMFGLSTTTSPAIGKIGQALKFSSSVVNGVYSLSSPVWSLSGSITESSWFKQNNQNWENHVAPSLCNDVGLRYWGGTTPAYAPDFFYCTPSNGCFGVNGATPIASTDHTWHFIAGTYDYHSGMLSVYLDGKLASSSNIGQQAFGTDGASAVIGQNECYNGYSFDGDIDEARIYNRALSAQEVAQLYALGQANVAHSSTASLSSSLAAYWTFDGNKTNWATGTTQDSSGNGNTGQLVGMSTTTSPALGKIGQALKFNGSSQYITLPNMALAAHNSVSAWVYINGTAQTGRIYNQSANVGDNGNNLSMQYCGTDQCGTPGIRCIVGNNGGGQFVGSTVSIPTKVWTHAILVHTATACVIYINGVAKTSGTTATTEGTGSYLQRIGARLDGAELFNGSLDDIRIYTRALSPQEAAQLYSMSR
ncbi:MAG: LamG domain-containing protein [Patescibacteria group bacterium]|nr:LamG domain-containing protein [Patescibacteria group bacterium]